MSLIFFSTLKEYQGGESKNTIWQTLILINSLVFNHPDFIEVWT